MKIKYIIITFLLVAIVFLFIKTTKQDVIYVISKIDDRKYLVRDTKDKQEAADMLAKVRKKLMDLKEYLKRNKGKYKDFELYIDRLDRFDDAIISENSDNGMYTSYTVDKGEQMVFCIRSKGIINSIHNINLIMYVAIHELGHVACPEKGHTELFKKIFAFLTKRSIEIGIYEKINFNDEPREYCGLTISESII